MPQFMIGQHDGYHGFRDGDAAYADAGVVAAFGLDIDFLTLRGDGAGFLHHGGGGFDRDAADDFVAIADAAQYAAGFIRKEIRAVFSGAHFVGIFNA